MKILLIAAAVLGLASPALAGSYRIVLDRPASGRLLIGHAGVQAADERTAATLVRVVAPGNNVDQRGTVRVLVMNLSPKTFSFGPDDVTLRLGDGTVLKPTPIEKFENGRMLIERESRYAGTIDLMNRNNLSSLAEQAGNGATAATGQPVPGGSAASSAAAGGAREQDLRSDSDLLPGASTLDAIYQILIPLQVEPQHAWGGYYVFDVPKDVQKRRVDQPLSITVRTGREEHRFSGTLRWK